MRQNNLYYGNTGCEVFKRGIRIGVVASCQKLGTLLENKVIEKLRLSENVNNKKCAPKFVLFRKIRKIFDVEN